MNHSIGSLPKHLYVWVDSRFTHAEPCGFVRGVWFGLASVPGRVWGCHVMFESGAFYRSVPPHAVAFREKPEKHWGVRKSQLWDCYGTDWSGHEYTYLRGMQCKALIGGKKYRGDYLFTVCPVGDGFSNAPEQAKEFMFLALNNGRLTIQPTNRVLFEDLSFTEPGPVPKLKLQTEVWSCE